MVLIYNVLNISTTSTVPTTIDTIFINALDQTINISSPEISGNRQRYLIKRIDYSSNYVILLPDGLDTIQNSNNQSIGGRQIIEIVSNGSNWEFIQNISL